MPSPPLLITKLYMPPLSPQNVPRPRLTQRLQTAAPLLLISAPPGFGKTTVMREFIAAADQPAAWLSLDPADNDPPRFWRYVIGALQTLSPQLADEALTLLQTTPDPPLELIATLILNAIAEQLPAFTLVLDDYHQIETAAIHTSLAFFIEHLPPNMRLALLTRSDPPLPLARLRARRQVVELRVNDLRFEVDEAAAFLRQTAGLELPASDVAAMEQRTEGWITGLQLAALSLRGRSDARQFVRDFTGSHHFIADYLIDEALAQQTPEIQDFLLRTSILDRLTGPLCDAVVGLEAGRSAELLDQLARANLFLIPLDDVRVWFRYHHLFAEVLLSVLKQRLPGEVSLLYQRAADWLAANGWPAEALALFFKAGEIDRAADQLVWLVDTLRARGEVRTLERWLNRLPDDVIAARPTLGLARALSLLTLHDLPAAEAWLDRVEHVIGTQTPSPELIGEALLLRASIAQRHNDFVRVLDLARAALHWLPADDLSRRARAMHALAVALSYETQVADALPFFEQAVRTAEEAAEVSIVVNGAANLGIVLSAQGQWRPAHAAVQRGLTFAQRHRLDQLPMTGRLHSTLAMILHDWNRLDEAAAHFETAIDLHDRSSEPYSRMLSRAQYAVTLQMQGKVLEAQRRLAEAQQLAADHHLPRLSCVQLIAAQVDVWLMQNNRAALTTWLADCGLSIDDALSTVQEPEHYAFARALLGLGQPDRALPLIDRLRAAAASAGWHGTELEARVLRCVALQQLGRSAEARAELLDLLPHAEAAGRIRLFVERGPVMHTLLRETLPRLADATVRPYAERVVAAFDATPIASSALKPAPQPLIDPLSERECEVLRLVAEGLTDRQIADRLVLAVGTIKRHLNNVYGKLGVNSRTQALARARDIGLL